MAAGRTVYLSLKVSTARQFLAILRIVGLGLQLHKEHDRLFIRLQGRAMLLQESQYIGHAAVGLGRGKSQPRIIALLFHKLPMQCQRFR